MDREAAAKQMKALKAKAKDARKNGKRDLALAFNNGVQRLSRKLKATTPRNVKKTEGEAAKAP